MNLKYVHYVFVLVIFLSIPSFDFLYVQNFIDLISIINILIYQNAFLWMLWKIILKKNLLSIIIQSFQDFKITIVNDASEDKTENIIYGIQSNDNRIKLLSHTKKLGVYGSRIETIFNSKSEYFLIIAPDGMH